MTNNVYGEGNENARKCPSVSSTQNRRREGVEMFQCSAVQCHGVGGTTTASVDLATSFPTHLCLIQNSKTKYYIYCSKKGGGAICIFHSPRPLPNATHTTHGSLCSTYHISRLSIISTPNRRLCDMS